MSVATEKASVGVKWETVTQLVPYIPLKSNLRGYYLDVQISGGVGHRRIEDMPFEQMNILIQMLRAGFDIKFDPKAEHFTIPGNGQVADWK